jgi:2-C-methyl-D-erythritol 4-phosphate cytidylyltransferase
VDDAQSFVKNIPNRIFLQRAQTPQAFKVKTITKAYKIALKDPDFQSTDDCGIVAKYLPDEKIYIVRGEERNMKLTHKEDVFLLENLFRLP